MIGDNLINREDSCKVRRLGEGSQNWESPTQIRSLPLKSGELEPLKPISTVTVYKPPTDNHFLDYLSKGLNDFNLMQNDLFILDNTNITFLIMVTTSCINVKRKSNFGAIPKESTQICSMLGLKQLIKHPMRITCHTSTLTDQIITN